MKAQSHSYLLYGPKVEETAPDEAATFQELSDIMQHITRTMAGHYRHAYRPVHAKSHGVLTGTLEVLPGLPEFLAQGLFARPNSYPVIMRFSTNPGDLLADNVSSPRGLAIKVLGVEDGKVANHAGQTTQDFLCINAKAFAAPDPKAFLKQIKLFDKNLETSEGVKHAVSVVARATNAVLRTVHLSSATLEGIGAPATHILGETFSTVTALRYGSHVAKVSFAPKSANLKELAGKGVDLDEDYNSLENLIRNFFQQETGIWDVRAQLAVAANDTDVTTVSADFPVEKADKEWSEEKSPWQSVATLTVAPQDSYSDARQLFVDEQLSFSPWHALEAHQPLGGINRARLKAYEEAIRYRAQRNARQKVEPRNIAEVPA